MNKIESAVEATKVGRIAERIVQEYLKNEGIAVRL